MNAYAFSEGEIMMLAEVATVVIVKQLEYRSYYILNPICIVSRTFESIVFL